MNRKWQIAGFLLLGTGAAIGCTSMRSIFLHRDESNTSWTKERRLPGVPITLRVPTHLRVTVVEKHFLVVNSGTGETRVTRVNLPSPIRAVTHELVYTEKIFTVDFKRPAAGKMKLSAEFENQYFKKIEHEVEDETIEQVANLLSKIAPGGLFSPASIGESKAFADNVQEVDSVVAVRLFEIDEPDFEEQLTAFLDCHVNQSHDAWVSPPGVEEIRRLPLTQFSGNAYRDPLCTQGDCENAGEQIPVLERGAQDSELPMEGVPTLPDSTDTTHR